MLRSRAGKSGVEKARPHLTTESLCKIPKASHMEPLACTGEQNSSSPSRSSVKEGPSSSSTNGKGGQRRKGHGGLKRHTKLIKSNGLARNGRKRDNYSGSSGDLSTSSHEPGKQVLDESKKRKLSDETKPGGSEAFSSGGPNPLKSGQVIGTPDSLGRVKENVSLGRLGKDLGGNHGFVGLRNLGNTCFMNAVLQSLSKIRGFSSYISYMSLPPDQLRVKKRKIFHYSGSPFHGYSTRPRKNVTPANQIVLKSDRNQIRGTEEVLTTELQKIFILLDTKDSSAVSPVSLFRRIWEVMPRFRGYQQQDAHEFLRYMLDELHNELVRLVPTFSLKDVLYRQSGGLKGAQANKMIGPKKWKMNVLRADAVLAGSGHKGTPSIVTSLFGGVLENEVLCSRCGTESKKHESFLDLSLDIPMGNGGEARLEDCLSRFTDIEELSENDKTFCFNCDALQRSTKRLLIRCLPTVLCIHLKRFSCSGESRTKLDHYVQFPMTSLDMSDYLQDSSQTTRGSVCSNLYDLESVIVHHGTGVEMGHYTAFARTDSHWYHFNDSSVKESEEANVAKCKAYILFYTRRQFKL